MKGGAPDSGDCSKSLPKEWTKREHNLAPVGADDFTPGMLKSGGPLGDVESTGLAGCSSIALTDAR